MEYGGIEYAELKMNQYRDKALAILDSYPDSEVKESLREFVQVYNIKEKIRLFCLKGYPRNFSKILYIIPRTHPEQKSSNQQEQTEELTMPSVY
jgi:hypothetical protein